MPDEKQQAQGSELSDLLGAGKKPRIKWMHPSWDMYLITDSNFTVADLVRNDFLSEGDNLLLVTAEGVWMTDAEVEDLGEWDG